MAEAQQVATRFTLLHPKMEMLLDGNSFFSPSLDRDAIHRRILELEKGKVGLYSVGLYPASLAYNCAMQKTSEGHLLLAPPTLKKAWLAAMFEMRTYTGPCKLSSLKEKTGAQTFRPQHHR